MAQMEHRVDDLEDGIEDDLDTDWSAEEDLEGVSYVCEDCDYRWEESGMDEVEGNIVCPMCGSINVTQL
jgi:DNA-directed RNA polymerase subunit RPC12/RpoP